MKAEVKNLRTCRGDESDAFSCTLWVDGTKVADVRQAGNGGCHDWRWTDGKRNVHDALLGWLKAERPDFLGDVLDFSEPWHDDEALDMLVWHLIGQAQEEKMLRRHCRTKVVFRLAGDEEGEWQTIRGTWAGNEDHIRRTMRDRYGDRLAEIANERFA